MTFHPLSLIGEKHGETFQVDRPRLQRYLQTLPDGRYEIAVTRYVETRSNAQNRYYHGVIVKGLAEYWGLDHDDAHELIKWHCNPKTLSVVNQQTGEVEEKTIGGSTARLNKEEWSEFIERCHRWAAENFDFVIADPDPEYMFNKQEERPHVREQQHHRPI